MDRISNDSRRAAARARAGLTLLAVAGLVAACSGSGGAATNSAAPGSPGAAAASTVTVNLQEFAVVPDVTSVPAGTVTFVVNNAGPDDVHELVVIKTDLAVDALPVDQDGRATEGVEGVTLIGEVEDIEVGASKEVALDLEPGKYALICNILQTEPDGSLEAHYKVGMRTAFEVTAP